MFEEYESDVDSSITKFTASASSGDPDQLLNFEGPPDRKYPRDAEPDGWIDPATTFQTDEDMRQNAFARQTDLEQLPGYYGESESNWDLRLLCITFPYGLYVLDRIFEPRRPETVAPNKRNVSVADRASTSCI
jgi:hypothetical protein